MGLCWTPGEQERFSTGWQWLIERQRVAGSIRVMGFGDSMCEGASNNQGLRLPFLAGLTGLGFAVRTVGDNAGSTGAERVLYNTYGGQNSLYSQAKGSTHITDLLNGTVSGWSKFEQALATHKPDLIFGHFGTVDPGPSASDAERFFTACRAYNPAVPVVIATPHDSNSTANSYYNVDTGRATRAETIRSAAESCGTRAIVVNGPASIGWATRYRNDDVTVTNSNANAVYLDSTHLNVTGLAIQAAAMLSALSGIPLRRVADVLETMQPYQPAAWSYSADVTAGSGAQVMVDSGRFRHSLHTLTVYNYGGTGDATVVVARRRKTGGGAFVSDTSELATFKVPQGGVRGFAGNKETVPTAHYNEGWIATVTGSNCNIEATGLSRVF